MLSEEFDAVIGVDTHSQTHTLAVCAANGGILHIETIQANPQGHTRALELAAAAGARVVFAIEGTRSYGIGLARTAQGAGFKVIEAAQPTRASQHGKGKSDEIDAVKAARGVLGLDPTKLPAPPR